MAMSPNTRPPCGQTNNRPVNWFGGCYNQIDTTINGIKVKHNVTQMKDYASVAYNPNGINPYGFANQSGPGGGAPDCSPYWPGDPTFFVCGATGGEGNGSLPCGLPDPTDIMPCGGAPTQSFTAGLGLYHNCFVQTDETKSFSDCRNVGFKNAFAYKTQFGRLSYNSRQWGSQDIFDWCGCGYGNGTHQYDPTPDDVRYLSMTATASFSRTGKVWCISTADGCVECGDPPVQTPNCCTSLGDPIWSGTDTGNASNAVHVDRYSGDFFVDSCSSGSSTYADVQGGCDCTTTAGTCCDNVSCVGAGNNPRDPDQIAAAIVQNANDAFGMLGAANGSILDVTSLWSFYDCAGDTTNCRCTVAGGGSAWTATFQIQRFCSTGGCTPDFVSEWVTVQVISVDTVAGTADSISYQDDMNGLIGCPYDGGCVPKDNFFHQHYDISDTSYHYATVGPPPLSAHPSGPAWAGG